jgi:hypothetical protein
VEDKVNAPSLMPDGMVDPLTRQELLDLVRFRRSWARSGRTPWGRARGARWQGAGADARGVHAHQRNSDAAVARGDATLTWSPAYSRVSGPCYRTSCRGFTRKKVFAEGMRSTAFVRCQLDVSTAGKAKLRFGSAVGLTLWLDGEPIDAKDDVILELPQACEPLPSPSTSTRRKEGCGRLDDVAGCRHGWRRRWQMTLATGAEAVPMREAFERAILENPDDRQLCGVCRLCASATTRAAN